MPLYFCDHALFVVPTMQPLLVAEEGRSLYIIKGHGDSHAIPVTIYVLPVSMHLPTDFLDACVHRPIQKKLRSIWS